MSSFPQLHFLISAFSFSLVAQSSAQLANVGSSLGWISTPFNPPALPLAVRSPYFDAWLSQGDNTSTSALNTEWPNLWYPDPSTVVEWAVAIRVDNISYTISGPSVWPNSPAQISSRFTPTRTIFEHQAGPVDVKTSFLSPVNPADLVRQSLPFSYLYINVSSNDGNAHDVQLYSDICVDWVTGTNNSIIEWLFTNQSGVIVVQGQRQNIARFTETDGHAEDIMAYYSVLDQAGVTFKLDQDFITRDQFTSNGTLDGGIAQPFRPFIAPLNALAISIDLGSIRQMTSPVVWGLGLFRDPAIQYTALDSEVQLRSNYYWSNFSTPFDAVKFSLEDFEGALNNASALDTKIQNDASQYSSEYADLVALTLRQALGPIEITLGKDDNGNWNFSDVKAFMKNLGSGNGSGAVNVVDVLYAAFPAYLYLYPQLGKYLLTPLLESQESAIYINEYAAQNLGMSYPNATGNPETHNLGIEESANMLIMVLAHAQSTGDASLITQHYHLLQKWADYLVANSLFPGNQETSDGFLGANQTNLAIKGIIGIGAMARISAFVSNLGDSAMYQNTSVSYVQQWETLSKSTDGGHLLAFYGAQSSSGLVYNLYADKLLQLNLVPQAVYDNQTKYYASQLEQNPNQFGLPIGNNIMTPTTGRTDWMMLTAGTITESEQAIQELFVSSVHSYASSNINNAPLALSYNILSGSAIGNISSPAQGAVFSLLALNRTILFNPAPPSSTVDQNSNSAQSTRNVGAIAGGVAGGVVGLLLVLCSVLFFRRYKRRKNENVVDLDLDSGHITQYIDTGPLHTGEHLVPSGERESLLAITPNQHPSPLSLNTEGTHGTYFSSSTNTNTIPASEDQNLLTASTGSTGAQPRRRERESGRPETETVFTTSPTLVNHARLKPRPKPRSRATPTPTPTPTGPLLHLEADPTHANRAQPEGQLALKIRPALAAGPESGSESEPPPSLLSMDSQALVHELRSEVVHLRREMEQIRAREERERLPVTLPVRPGSESVPPPAYASLGEGYI